MRGLTLIIVLAFAITAACFGSKRGTGRGTNVGTGSNYDGPWNQGGGSPTIAAQPR